MKNVFLSIPDSAITALGWTLVHTLWQATVLAVASWVAFRLLRNSTAAKRYVVSISALAAQVFFSIATFAYYFTNLSAVKLHPYPATAISPTEVSYTLQKVSFLLKAQLWLSTHMHELVVCWLIGAGVLMLRFLAGWTFTQTLRNGSTPVQDARWNNRFGQMVKKLGIKTEVEFRETAKILSPVVIGALKPTVLLPFGLLTGFSPNQIEAIVAHELAHIYRRDYLVNLLQSLVEVVFFFHPAIWWLSECVRREREFCCDDMAIQMSGDRVSLAGALAQVAEIKAAASLAMAFASKKPLLLQRIRHVLGVAPKEPQQLTTLPMILVAFSLVLGISFYATGQSDKQTMKPKRAVSKTLPSKNRQANVWESDTIIAGKIPRQQTEEDETELEDIEVNVEPEVNFNLNLNTDSLILHSMHISDPEIAITISSKLREVNGLNDNESNALQLRIGALCVEAAKVQFQVDRLQRVTEKLDWKKDIAAESRIKLAEKRRSLLAKEKNGHSEEIEKVLSELEEQLVQKEDEIMRLSEEIIESRSETTEARAPLSTLEAEIKTLSERVGKSYALSNPANNAKSLNRSHYSVPKEKKTSKSTGAKTITSSPAKRIAPASTAPKPPIKK